MKSLFLIIIFFIEINVNASPKLELFLDDPLTSLKKISRLSFNSFEFKTKYLPSTRYEIATFKMKTEDKRSVQFTYFKNIKNGKYPLIILIPPIGGITPMEYYLAHYFGERNYNVIIPTISSPIGQISISPNQLNEAFLSTNADTRGVISYISKFPEINAKNMVAIGTSLGGIRLALMLTVEKRIKAAGFIVAGADLPSIMRNSLQKSVKKYRQYFMEKYFLQNEDEFEKLLRNKITVDPLLIKNKFPADKVIFFQSSIDKDVPFKNQQLLWEILGKPARHMIALPHIPAAGYFALKYSNVIYKFFQDSLENQN